MKRILCSLFIAFLIFAPFTSVLAEEYVDKLIKQLKGEAVYYDIYGKESGYFDEWTVRHFKKNGIVAAAVLLGKMGPGARKAVPALIEFIENGPDNFDTGDGVIPLRSSAVDALGKIGDKRAVKPLVKKLREINEKIAPANKRSQKNKIAKADTSGARAVVEALGMFAGEASEALPHITRLCAFDIDADLRNICQQSASKIKGPENKGAEK
jgi:HEAT repeat protein